MAIRMRKKAVAFSFLALFISFLLVAWGNIYFDVGVYTKDSDFKTSRLLQINSEIDYFKDVYIPNALSFSFYNTLQAIIEYSRSPENYSTLQNNYTRLQQLIYEGITRGELDGVPLSSLENKTLTTFLDDFSNDFSFNQKANLSFNILNLRVYEKTPYYLDLQILAEYRITTQDNISSWNFTRSFSVSVPLDQLNDPQFAIYDLDQAILPVIVYKGDENWSYEAFNESLSRGLSVVYIDPVYRYSIGTSFLDGLLNISESAFQGVQGFWSFDYDEEEKEVFDLSVNRNPAELKGYTKLFFSFDNGSISAPWLQGETDYNRVGLILGALNCNSLGLFNLACNFDGIDDSIELDALAFEDLFENINEFSIAFWVNPQVAQNQTIFSYGFNLRERIEVRLTDQNILEVEIGNHSSLNATTFRALENSSLNEWNFFVFTYDGVSREGRIYKNSVLVNKNSDGSIPQSEDQHFSFMPSSSQIAIGSDGSSNYFDGLIDEFQIFTKELEPFEIASLYGKFKGSFVEYKTSLYDKGLSFDGRDFYVDITNSQINLSSNYTLSFWIRPYNKTNTSQYQGVVILKNDLVIQNSQNSQGLRFFLNGSLLEFDISPGDIGNLQTPIVRDKWNQISAVYNSDLNRVDLYRNGELVTSNLTDMSYPNLRRIFISFSYLGNSYQGMFDEFKIYDYAFSSEQVKTHYFNYEQRSKGCCNSITLIDSNRFGFNTPQYSTISSSSSKLFFDTFRRKENYNVTLFNLTNITSSSFAESYYNFHADICLMNAFDVFSFDFFTEIVNVGADVANCTRLIELGIY